MKKNKNEQVQDQDQDIINNEQREEDKLTFLEKRRKTLKDLIAPAGIDASNPNYLQIASGRTRYARSMIMSTIPRMCTFPEFVR